MQKLNGYMAGANLGGWISQYGDKSHDHHKSFIVEDDIKLIASWGMDHIRIPVDCPVLEDENNPGTYLEQGFEYLVNGVQWAKKHGLNAVIDLHKAPGFSFSTLEENSLFTDSAKQQQMIELWKEIARCFKGEGPNVMYELINEVVEPDSSRWNPLAQKLIDGVREIDADHFIVVGGNNYNSVTELVNLAIFDDPKIVYNFHMYVPMLLTHQHASWVKDLLQFNRDVVYPSDLSAYRDYAKQFPAQHMDVMENFGKIDVEYVRWFMQPAVDFLNKHDKPMYCGEYGVIDNAEMDSRVNWTNDVSDFLLEHGIGRAIWSYKQMGFKLVDTDRNIVSDRLIQAASKL